MLAHTADTAFEAWGPTRADCFGEAVRALVASFADVSRAPLVDRLHVRFGPAAEEDVLVELLEEVIYLLDTRGLVVAVADLRDEEDGALSGQLELSDVVAVQASGAVPKAITYHGLRVDAGEVGWRCHVTIDV
ncbi:MAG: archease [Nitriliruptorales bacterium]